MSFRSLPCFITAFSAVVTSFSAFSNLVTFRFFLEGSPRDDCTVLALSTSSGGSLISLPSISVCLHSSVGSSVEGVLALVASGVVVVLPVDVEVLAEPISRSTGGFTTALVPKTLCNFGKNLKLSSIPLHRIQYRLHSSSVCQLRPCRTSSTISTYRNTALQCA